MATETIPVIDLGPFLAGEPGALDRTAKELRFALTEIGFYFIVNHGVPREKIRGAFDQVKRFHAQPVEKKLELKIDLHSTGYLPMRGNTLRTSTIRPAPSPTSTRPSSSSARCRPTIPTCWPTAASAAPTAGRGSARLPRDRRRLLRHAGTAGAEDGAALRPRPRPAGGVFRRAVQGLPVLAAHDALPASGRPRSRTSSASRRTPTPVS